jgi:class 3 adenylate cyclase
MITCSRCGQENPERARFCNACAAPLESTDDGRVEERKVVTVLFADLVGFTSRAERMDPEEVRSFLRPYHARLRDELERFGGTVEKFIGDAVMAVFGAPVRLFVGQVMLGEGRTDEGVTQIERALAFFREVRATRFVAEAEVLLSGATQRSA